MNILHVFHPVSEKDEKYSMLFNRGGTAVINRPLQTQVVCVCRGLFIFEKEGRKNDGRNTAL